MIDNIEPRHYRQKRQMPHILQPPVAREDLESSLWAKLGGTSRQS